MVCVRFAPCNMAQPTTPRPCNMNPEPESERTMARRRMHPTMVAWMAATLRSTLVLSTAGTQCFSARRYRYSCPSAEP